MVRVRIAPSPTGKDLHVGSVATALMNFAWAKRNKGQFIVRIEDTDRHALSKAVRKKCSSRLSRLGWFRTSPRKPAGPSPAYRQSQRLSLYQRYAAELVAAGRHITAPARRSGLTPCEKNSRQPSKAPNTTASATGTRKKWPGG
jgi:glutamyl-tRNA synthetase